MRKIYIPFLFLLTFNFINAQFDEYYPEYSWYTIKSKHSEVHYHLEAERTARIVAKIIDEIWDPITTLYQYEPETIHFVIKDIDDFSNGATYFFDNKIELWSSALDTDLRGTHNWLRNVVSHEFTHMVQIQSAMKLGRTIPAIYLQFLNYEDKRRPDVLYGFPNFIMSYPVATFNIPAWFAEGTAQYQRKEFNYDSWDSHRDMIIRCYAFENKLLTWNEMGVFSKTSLGNESVYNSGFALILFITQKYGEDKLRLISEKLGSFTNFTIDAAFEDVLGKSGVEIYSEWSNYVKEDYSNRIKSVIENRTEGEKIIDDGFGNFYPVFLQDDQRIIYVSNKGADYFGISNLYLYDLNTKKSKFLETGVRSNLSYIPNQNKIIYSKLTRENENWVEVHDIYVYDIDEDEETRLTQGLRANNPSVSHDGKNIVFVYQKDGTTNLGIVDINGKNFRTITLFGNGEQVYNPKFTIDDSKIIFDYTITSKRDIAIIDTSGANLELLLNGEYEERDPFVISENLILYSSNETGIYNIYSYDLKSKETKRVTNVIGGAFMPSGNSKGDICYSGYTSDGYKIFQILKAEQGNVLEEKKYIWKNNPPLNTEIPNGDINNYDIYSLINFDDTKVPNYEATKYKGSFSRLSVLPFIRYDNYNTSNSIIDRIKPGVYLLSSDMLNRFSIFAGGSVNTRGERDLFLQLDYRDKLPLLFDLGLKPQLTAELYSISRKANVDIFFGIDSTSGDFKYDYKIKTDVTYDLFEFDFVAKHKIFSIANEIETRFIFSSYTATLGSFILPDEDNTLYPSTKDTYLIGRNIQVKFTHNGLLPHVDSEINPIGRKVEFQYNYEFNKFNSESEYEVEDGMLIPKYGHFNFHRVELNWKEHLGLFASHTLTLGVRAASILGPEVPDFFDYYLGGLIGMKAYPFYAISGNELICINLTYRFPLFRNIDFKLGHLYLDKIFLSIYGDYGDAWTGIAPKFNSLKKGVGAEIRMSLISFYMFPTSIFLNASYSFDEYTRVVHGEDIKYGKEWQFYGGILFDFSF
ncbi:MAG: PD40 domain-containing protein [Ignavibacteriales bacterium]|nr:PD40 domain-containing protein [Ignavibacteriales bacterium]